MGVDFIDTSYAISTLYFASSLCFIIKQQNIRALVKSTVLVLRFFALTIIGTFFLSLFDSFDAIHILVENGVMFYGGREYAGFNFPYIYFVASPMLVFLLCYECANYSGNKSIILILIACVAMVLSGTRFSIILAFVIPLYYITNKSYTAKIICYPLIVVSGLYLFSEILASFFSVTDVSNESKIGYLSSYVKIFSDPSTLFFGQGFNAHAWSSYFNDMLVPDASKTELTYLELARVFGLPLMIANLFFVAILYNFLPSSLNGPSWSRPTLVFYGLISSLNPYLFSSNGMIVFSLIISQLYTNKNDI